MKGDPDLAAAFLRGVEREDNGERARAVSGAGSAFSNSIKAASAGYYPPSYLPPLKSRPRLPWRRRRWEAERLRRLEAEYERDRKLIDVLDEFRPTPEDAERWLRLHRDL